MTSAQKEIADQNMSDDDEETLTNKDIIIYQSLSTMLLLISNLQHEIGFGGEIHSKKLFATLSSNMEDLNKLRSDENYSNQNITVHSAQLLNLQTSAYEKIVLRSLEAEQILNFSEFINQTTLVYIENIASYAENLNLKQELLSKLLRKVPSLQIEKMNALVLVLLLKQVQTNSKVKFNEEDPKAKIFEIENEEFKIAQKLLYNIMKSAQAITSIRHLIMVMNYVVIYHKDTYQQQYTQTAEFIDKKVGLLFNTEYTDSVKIDSKWIESLFADQTGLSKMKYIFLILLDDILPKQSHTEKYGKARHPLVRTFQELSINKNETTENSENNESSTNQNVKDLVLAFDLGTTIIEHQQSMMNGKKLKN